MRELRLLLKASFLLKRRAFPHGGRNEQADVRGGGVAAAPACFVILCLSSTSRTLANNAWHAVCRYVKRIRQSSVSPFSCRAA